MFIYFRYLPLKRIGNFYHLLPIPPAMIFIQVIKANYIYIDPIFTKSNNKTDNNNKIEKERGVCRSRIKVDISLYTHFPNIKRDTPGYSVQGLLNVMFHFMLFKH